MRLTKIVAAKKRGTTLYKSTSEIHELSYYWPGLKTVGVVMSFRSEGDEVPAEPMIRYYISSAELSAKKFVEAASQHWHVENKLHWSLAVALREDAFKIHRGYVAESLAIVRYIALNYLKGETNFKGGIRRKQKKAALDENYPASILAV
jgi:predicted transposase YbfD/YdcC